MLFIYCIAAVLLPPGSGAFQGDVEKAYSEWIIATSADLKPFGVDVDIKNWTVLQQLMEVPPSIHSEDETLVSTAQVVRQESLELLASGNHSATDLAKDYIKIWKALPERNMAKMAVGQFVNLYTQFYLAYYRHAKEATETIRPFLFKDVNYNKAAHLCATDKWVRPLVMHLYNDSYRSCADFSATIKKETGYDVLILKFRIREFLQRIERGKSLMKLVDAMLKDPTVPLYRTQQLLATQNLIARPFCSVFFNQFFKHNLEKFSSLPEEFTSHSTVWDQAWRNVLWGSSTQETVTKFFDLAKKMACGPEVIHDNYNRRLEYVDILGAL